MIEGNTIILNKSIPHNSVVLANLTVPNELKIVQRQFALLVWVVRKRMMN